MARLLCLLAFTSLCAAPLTAAELRLVQETGFSAQVQTVQAQGYWGTQQVSYGAQWTLGVDVDRTFALRGGLSTRAVRTSEVVHYTVYPGYLGWGWVAALDALPFRGELESLSWAAGATFAFGYEHLSYPGLFREFELPSYTLALLADVVLPDTSGLAYRVRLPVTLDQRQGFSLSWRLGLEVAVAFRGITGRLP